MRMNVLLSTYACEPNKGSEPGIGWNWVKQTARFNNVWVFTRSSNRASIETALGSHPIPNTNWVYFDLPRWLVFWEKGQRGIRLHYCLWQLGIYWLAKRLNKQVGFHVVHHVTFVNYWLPIFISLLSIPLLWGPIGGGESSPKAFYRSFSLRGRLFEYVRDAARWMGEKNPFLRLTARRAKIALATTPETEICLKRIGTQKVQVLSQIALGKKEMENLLMMPFPSPTPFRLLSIGNMLHWKGFHLSVMAFVRFAKVFPECQYWLIGDGPEKKRLEKRVKKLGIAPKVHFWGRLSRQEVFEKIGKCVVLVHPSLHDSGGGVCLEAMAAGRPVICLELGGPALQVDKQAGFKIEAKNPEQVIRDLCEKFILLAQDTGLVYRMGEMARLRVKEHFDWDAKGERINTLYQAILTR